MAKITWEYMPTERQFVAHNAKERYKLFGGAMGGGKSVWLVCEMIQLMLEYPGNRGVLCRYHLSDLKNTTLVSFFKMVPEGLLNDASHNKSERIITFPNGSQILYMGLSEEQDISKFKSNIHGYKKPAC